MKKRFVTLLVTLALILSMMSPALAANNTTDYNSFSTPGSSDYAYWSGSQVVRASGTTTSEVKWMQAALNYCIKNKGLSASYLDVDGSFGPASQTATKAFQRKYGLSVDGSFGPDTIAKMKSVLAESSSPKAASIANGWYTLTPACATNMRLDLYKGSSANRANIEIYQNNSGDAQKFKITSLGNGYFTIGTCNNNMVLDVEGGGTALGTNVLQYTLGPSENQQWRAEDAGNGYVYIISKLSSSLALDVYNANTTNETNVHIWEKNYTNAQKWKLTATSAPGSTSSSSTTTSTASSSNKTTSSANNTTDYNSFSTPGSSDYAYWSGSQVVRASGTTTSEVKWMQAALNYCIKNKGLSASYLDVDGSFGPASQTATKAFQRKYGLSVDGSFGPDTIQKMKEVLGLVPAVVETKPAEKPAEKPVEKPAEKPTPAAPAEEPSAKTYTTDYSAFSMPGNTDYAYWSGSKSVTASGTTTSEVKWMQAALNYCIKNKGLSASYLDVTGSFDAACKTATMAFQRKYGLSADGSFGPATIRKMQAALGIPEPNPTIDAPSNTKSSLYNPTKAVDYAAAKWNNGVGWCAEFVSNCLKAGGLSSWNRECTNLYNQLYKEAVVNAKIASVQELTASNSSYVRVADNKGKVSKGDAIFWYCGYCASHPECDSAGGPYQHTALVGDVSKTYVQIYAHHNPKNNAPAWFGNCNECGRPYSRLVAIHFN